MVTMECRYFVNGDPFDTIAIVLPRKECNANARLLAAAYNAFDSAAKKLGVNAVEFAERMQDGVLFDLIDAAQFAAETFEHSGCEKNVCPICLIRAILAKVNGGAS